MQDMGEVSYILGMTATRNYKQGTSVVTQKDYAHYIVEIFELHDSRPAYTPGYRPELSNKQPEHTLLCASDIKLYQVIAGSVIYLD